MPRAVRVNPAHIGLHLQLRHQSRIGPRHANRFVQSLRGLLQRANVDQAFSFPWLCRHDSVYEFLHEKLLER